MPWSKGGSAEPRFGEQYWPRRSQMSYALSAEQSSDTDDFDEEDLIDGLRLDIMTGLDDEGPEACEWFSEADVDTIGR